MSSRVQSSSPSAVGPILRLLLTDPEVAQALNVSPKTVYNLRRTGRLRYIRVGRSVRVEQSAVDEFIASRREEAL